MRLLQADLPNKALQLTAGNCGFNNVFWIATVFGLSDVLPKIAAATELGSLGTSTLLNMF